jgi:hypothetical protein
MEFETRKNDYIILKFNRKRTVPITIFLRTLAAVDDGMHNSPLNDGSDEVLMSLFQDVDNNPDRLFIASTLRQEPVWDLADDQTVHRQPGLSSSSVCVLEGFHIGFFPYRFCPGGAVGGTACMTVSVTLSSR